MAPRILLLGGHGKVALFMTPRILHRSWELTSVIRNPDHEADIKAAAGSEHTDKLHVLVSSLDDITSEQAAQKVIDEAKPDYVIWSAGAGGKGGPARTYAIDRDAAKHFIAAAAHTPSVKKFLMVSYTGSRRRKASWWTDWEWEETLKVHNEYLPDYHKAKLDADEFLVARAAQRNESDPAFQAICLRPGPLTLEPSSQKIQLGKTRGRGKISREDVADVAVRLLESDEVRGYIDLMQGDEDTQAAVDRVIKSKEDAIEGEDVEAILAKYKQ